MTKWCVWADGTFCEFGDFEEYTLLSDDIEIIENNLGYDEMDEFVCNRPESRSVKY